MKSYLIKTEINNAISSITKRIWVDGVEILPETACSLRRFYVCDFDWGEAAGDASYTTAMAICLAIFKEERIAENLFVLFNKEFVRRFPDGSFELVINLESFLSAHRDRLHPYLYSCFCFSSPINSREILLYKNPVSGKITANLAENYALHNRSISNLRVRALNERKQRLILKLFARDSYIISGDDIAEVMKKVEQVMSVFYWKSMEKVIQKQFLDKYK